MPLHAKLVSVEIWSGLCLVAFVFRNWDIGYFANKNNWVNCYREKTHAMSHYDIWFSARRPFILPLDPYVPHKCMWEKFAYDMAGCTVCGSLHKCDALTCKHQESTDDSVLCVITGCYLGPLYASENWNDRGISSSFIPQNVTSNEFDVETHVHDLLLSCNARRCLEYEQRKIFQYISSKLNNQALLHNCHCAVDVVSNIIKVSPLKTREIFCEKRRSLIKKRCLHAISDSVGILFHNSHVKICRSNHRHFIFGLVYLLRFGVKLNGRVVLPQMLDLNSVLPQETNMKAFFDVNPSSITDTENKLKFVLRQQHYVDSS
jgi:hypothetical protein